MDICGDNRFEIIAKAKADLLECTNIETDEAEMAVIDNILFRCWQMGWLDRYDRKTEPIPHDDYVETGNDHLKASRYEPQTESVYTPVTCKRCPVHEQCSQEDWRECRYDYIADKLNDEPQTERRGRVMKTCGDCVNCEKVHPKDGKEFWACEEYGIVFLGMPADVTPPNDEPCEFWTNDPKQKNKNYNAIMKLF